MSLRDEVLAAGKLGPVHIEVAIIDDVYLRTQRADIRIYRTDQPVRKVFVSSQYAGQGFGLVTPYEKGDIVLVAFIGGSVNTPIIIARLWTEKAYPPEAEANEVLLQHDTGAKVKVTGDGDVVLIPASGRKCYLGDEDGTKKIALHGDSTAGHNHSVSFSLTAPNGPVSGTITVGSNTDTIVASSENSEAK